MSSASSATEIREVILAAAAKLRPASPSDGSLQLNTLFIEVKRQLGDHIGIQIEQEVLTQWHELLRTGYFAWGLNLGNPSAPFFHFTERGARAVERLSRDPGNPTGYIRHLQSVASLNPIADSYLREGLDCYVAGLHKAAAVMLGGASESLVLELRDATVTSLRARGAAVSKRLQDWRVKALLDELHEFLDARKASFPPGVREEFEAYFLAFAQQIRSTRNDAGHPSSVDPVTEQSVHASFLMFPELARLNTALIGWVKTL